MKNREWQKNSPLGVLSPARSSAGIGGAIVLFAALAIAAPGTAASETLDAKQIKLLFSGTTMESVSRKGYPLFMKFAADGTASARLEGRSGDRYDGGEWWTQNNEQLCWWWKRFKELYGCYKVARKGNQVVRWRSDNGALIEGPDWTIDVEGPQAKLVAPTGSGAVSRPQISAKQPSRPFATASASVPLNSDQIKKLMSDTKVRAKTKKGDYPMHLTFEVGGNLTAWIERPDSVPADEGLWWTERERLLCWKFSKFFSAKVWCVTVTLDGNEIVRHISPSGAWMQPKWLIDKAGPLAGPIMQTASATPAPQPVQPQPRLVPTAHDRAPPSIEAPESVSATGAVAEFVGRVGDASQIVEVTVNGRPVAFEADGSVRIRRGVPQGRSTIIISALDEWGNRASRRITVTRAAPASEVASAPTISTQKTAKRTDTFSDIHFGTYHALVIGNNKYRELNQLKTAEEDANAVARVLRDNYGFEVEVLLNATRADLIGALTKLRAKLTDNDNLLIYYAGHGELDTITEQGYWLPVDAEADVPTNWVSTGDITTMVRAIRAKHIMVVADSCYSGTLVRASQTNIKTAKARHAWLERMATKRARTALVSGGLEPVVDGGGGDHSVFAKAFLDALKENETVLDGQALFDAIKRPIVVNADQTPQYSDIRRAGHDGGDFMFVRRR